MGIATRGSSVLRPGSWRSIQAEKGPRWLLGASKLRGVGTRTEGLPEARGESEWRAGAKSGCCPDEQPGAGDSHPGLSSWVVVCDLEEPFGNAQRLTCTWLFPSTRHAAHS